MSVLLDWQNFYAMVGSAAGALIGLQFILIALIADLPAAPTLAGASEAFGTPTVVHFGAALLVAGVMSAPWHALDGPAIVCAAAGLAGLVYAAVVALRLGRQSAYVPDLSDWFFYAVLPLAAYAVLGVSAWAASAGVPGALFGVAGASLLLLFIGLHNAWDSVTYHVFVQRPKHLKRRR
jgi:hypothetical protein